MDATRSRTYILLASYLGSRAIVPYRTSYRITSFGVLLTSSLTYLSRGRRTDRLTVHVLKWAADVEDADL